MKQAPQALPHIQAPPSKAVATSAHSGTESTASCDRGRRGPPLEHLTPVERARIAIEVGIDQFGGDRNPGLIEELVDTGAVTEERLDLSVRRLLREKFRLGAFENRRVDPGVAKAVCGEPDLAAKGEEAQRRSLVLVSEQEGADPVDAPVFVDEISAAAAAAAGLEVVDDIEAASAVLVRVDAAFEPGRGSLLAEHFCGGSLEFSADVLERLRGYARHAPVHVAVFLGRPAVLE